MKEGGEVQEAVKPQMKRKIKLNSFQLIIIGFASIIIFGALLLSMPMATNDGSATPFIDALFTSTSAVCVTGLIIHDTATHWSMFGQAVIIMLIQIGGMGIVTLSMTIMAASGKKIGIMQRSTMQEAISAHQIGGIVRLTKFIFKMVVIIELAGAAAMFPVFSRDFGVIKGIWYSIFHSISAFCNAGFDLMGVKHPFSSLTYYASQPVINITIMLLIIIGGIGFLTWDDIRVNKFRFSRYKMQSKVILLVTGLLIIIPAIYFFFIEFPDMPVGERLLNSFFQSVTPRTAGFNTADYSNMSETGQMASILLMLIGGSPGSTAGGFKTTTLAVLIASAVSVFTRKDQVRLFKRGIALDIIKTAATIFVTYIVLFLLGSMIISSIEGLPILTCMFETSSAIGTVGLSLGITPELGVVSHVILMLLMFFGRVGGLTIIFAAVDGTRPDVAKYPQEKITVG